MLVRPALLALLALALLAAPARAAHVADVRLASCDPVARTAVFDASMEAPRESVRMQMRFTLQVATQDRPGWSRLPGARPDRWLRADPGTQRYVHTRRVRRLVGPARYRMLVRFRWRDAAGRLLARERRVSPACHQPRDPTLLQ